MLPSGAPVSSVRSRLLVEGLNMSTKKFSTLVIAVAAAGLAALLVLPACSVNVKKEADGQDKQVDIHTLLGGVHVSNEAEVADVACQFIPAPA